MSSLILSTFAERLTELGQRTTFLELPPYLDRSFPNSNSGKVVQVGKYLPPETKQGSMELRFDVIDLPYVGLPNLPSGRKGLGPININMYRSLPPTTQAISYWDSPQVPILGFLQGRLVPGFTRERKVIAVTNILNLREQEEFTIIAAHTECRNYKWTNAFSAFPLGFALSRAGFEPALPDELHPTNSHNYSDFPGRRTSISGLVELLSSRSLCFLGPASHLLARTTGSPPTPFFASSWGANCANRAFLPTPPTPDGDIDLAAPEPATAASTPPTSCADFDCLISGEE
ncbi:unnamed protein product (mitochondrion) [Arabidopsis thaliana]|uniref:(thale cress) hypothetical protein n=1 Tax=Arabidopsis thaliana TaxID=3702 RepID=A0A7G2FNF9_ARATH|nr:unnamed protein product [Arabidopsis thaliana]